MIDGKEEWRTISRWPNYEASRSGQIRNKSTGKVRTPVKIKGGYLTIMFYKSGKNYLEYLHRLVAETFLENPTNCLYVNHKNYNKEDNSVQNLEWCTARKNVQHSRGRPVNQFRIDESFVQQYPSVREAERSIGAKHGPIGECANGKRRMAYGYKWSYCLEALQ